MSIADKLLTVASNTSAVFDKVNAEKTVAIGKKIALNDVLDMPHRLGVRLFGKNLVEYPYQHSDMEVNGLTFVDNGDGTVTVNGTATAAFNYNICTLSTHVWAGIVPSQDYTISLQYEGEYSGYVSFIVNYYPQGSSSYTSWLSTTIGDSRSKSAPENIAGLRSYMRIGEGTVVNNLILKPMLELGAAATEHELYRIDFSSITVTRTADGENDPQTAQSDESGVVAGLTSLAPAMTLAADTGGVILECTYFPESAADTVEKYLAVKQAISDLNDQLKEE